MNWIKRHIFGFRAEDHFPLSNARRFAGRVGLILTALAIFELSFSRVTPFAPQDVFWVAVVWSGYAILYFVFVVLLIGFYVANASARRLFFDTLISGVQMMFAAALLFRGIGIVGPNDVANESRDFVYFAAVTFSTLGFGDFRPVETARLAAAGLAVLGNLHLAVLVGAVFKAMGEGEGMVVPDPRKMPRRRGSRKARSKRSTPKRR